MFKVRIFDNGLKHFTQPYITSFDTCSVIRDRFALVLNHVTMSDLGSTCVL